MSLNRKTKNIIDKIKANITEAKDVITELYPLWNLKLKPNKIPKEELLVEFNKLLNTQKDSAKIINHFLSEKERFDLAQHLANVDYAIINISKKNQTVSKIRRKSKTSKTRSRRGRTKGGDNSVELVERQEKRVYFDRFLCTSLISIFVGIYLLYLAINELNALNEIHGLNINFTELFTSFENIRGIPAAMIKSIGEEVRFDIERRIRRGCMSASGNTATDLINSYLNAQQTTTCIVKGTADGIKNTIDMNSAQLKNTIDMCFTFTSYGLGLIAGGGTYVMSRLTGTSIPSMLLQDKSPPKRITRGGKGKKDNNNPKE